MPTLQIIIGSTRPVRVGPALGTWIHQRAVSHGAFDAELTDLAEVDLPMLDEPHHPRLRRYTRPHTLEWSATIDRADAFIWVLPEYNYGYTAPVKNAIDYLHAEWQYKPAGFVSYGGIAAGTRALQLLKPVLSAVKVVPVTEAVNVPFVQQFIGDDGTFQPTEILETAATAMLDELARWSTALATLRQQDGQ
jgi:NAD(P)H-dependent FMN reductase